MDSIVEFDWEIALGGVKMTLKELQMLAKLKQPLVKVRGEWVVLESQEIQAAIDFRKSKTEEARLSDLMKMSLGASILKGGLEFSGVKAAGWAGKFLSELQATHTLEEIPAPEGFNGSLRPYQTKGYSCGGIRRWKIRRPTGLSASARTVM